MRITNKHGPVGNIGIVGGKEGKEGEREGGREGGRKGGREEGIECTDTQNHQGNTRHHVHARYTCMYVCKTFVFFFYFSSYQYLQVQPQKFEQSPYLRGHRHTNTRAHHLKFLVATKLTAELDARERRLTTHAHSETLAGPHSHTVSCTKHTRVYTCGRLRRTLVYVRMMIPQVSCDRREAVGMLRASEQGIIPLTAKGYLCARHRTWHVKCCI